MSAEVAELYGRLQPAAAKVFGPEWVTPLAEAAKWKAKTLRTLFHRGKKLPPGDKLGALLEAVGLQGTSGTATPTATDPPSQIRPPRPVSRADLDALITLARHELAPIYKGPSSPERDEIHRHLVGQITLLAKLARLAVPPTRRDKTQAE